MCGFIPGKTACKYGKGRLKKDMAKLQARWKRQCVWNTTRSSEKRIGDKSGLGLDEDQRAPISSAGE